MLFHGFRSATSEALKPWVHGYPDEYVMSGDPRNLENAEIVREIHSLRDDMERLSARMVELSQILYGKVKRAPSDDFTARYVAFANAWTRFGSMVVGGIRRTSSATRLVETVAREKREAEEMAAREVPMPKKRPSTNGPTDLVALYGEEMVNRAR
jgi:hypothetical protein